MRDAVAVTLGFTGLRTWACKGAGAVPAAPAADGGAGSLISLPAGFTAVAISAVGETMDDGLRVPGRHDGTATFPAPGGRVLLVRNHELSDRSVDESAFAGPAPAALRELAWDGGRGGLTAIGGTTTLLYDPARRRLERHFLSLLGTLRNCAGGPTPWGTWISCEEALALPDDEFAQRHGYCFEVPARADSGLVEARPLPGMGRFNHEAIAVHPGSGAIYLTEDRHDGLLYRFVPEQPGRLERGRLQALALRDRPSADTRGWEGATPMGVGTPLATRWVDIGDPDPDADELRARGFEEYGAARFARGEGLWLGADGIYFTCTNGGAARQGQIWRYRPSVREARAGEEDAPGTLDLYYESSDEAILKKPDNLTVHPSGDLYVCEDSGVDPDRVVRIRPDGSAETFAANLANSSELTGATFSPDGRVLFVNVQDPGVTLAIHGPFSS